MAFHRPRLSSRAMLRSTLIGRPPCPTPLALASPFRIWPAARKRSRDCAKLVTTQRWLVAAETATLPVFWVSIARPRPSVSDERSKKQQKKSKNAQFRAPFSQGLNDQVQVNRGKFQAQLSWEKNKHCCFCTPCDVSLLLWNMINFHFTDGYKHLHCRQYFSLLVFCNTTVHTTHPTA